MRWRTLPVELLLLAFFAVFLLYPLAYVLPGAASDEEYDVVLPPRAPDAGARARPRGVLTNAAPDRPPPDLLPPPATAPTSPAARKPNADALADQLRRAGADAAVVHRRNWTG